MCTSVKKRNKWMNGGIAQYTVSIAYAITFTLINLPGEYTVSIFISLIYAVLSIHLIYIV